MFKTDTKSAWNGIRLITGMKKKHMTPDVQNPTDFCNELNTFYARFDKIDFSHVRNELVNSQLKRTVENIEITHSEVAKCLKSLKAGKAGGPDKINTDILKLCCEPLTPILRNIYQQSINEGKIPKAWKMSELVPVPKKSPPTCLNDYRPIALTSVLMKCLEKIVKKLLCEQVSRYTDKFQFAYTQIDVLRMPP